MAARADANSRSPIRSGGVPVRAVTLSRAFHWMATSAGRVPSRSQASTNQAWAAGQWTRAMPPRRRSSRPRISASTTSWPVTISQEAKARAFATASSRPLGVIASKPPARSSLAQKVLAAIIVDLPVLRPAIRIAAA